MNERCIDPDKIDERDLEAFSRGKTEPELTLAVGRHLVRCFYCRAVVVEYQNIERETAWLPRLVKFFRGLLS